MHTILGANGIIAQELSRELAVFGSDIRQVSRNPRKINPTDETFVADLLDGQAINKGGVFRRSQSFLKNGQHRRQIAGPEGGRLEPQAGEDFTA